jgi:tetratricopeptide (TPR) repeat protein
LRRTPVAAALDEIEAVFMEAMDRDPEQFIKLWNTAGRWLLDPSRTQTLVKIAPHLRSAGKPFLDVCSWLVKYGPGEAQSAGWLLLAHFYADLGDVAAAQSCLKQANSANDSDEVLRIRARIALASQDGPAASASIMKLHDVNEDDALLLLDAMKLLTNVKKETAFCDRAFQKKTYSLKTTVRFADILYAAGSRQKALAYYRAAVAVKPGKSLKDVNTAADADWAYYRISAIAKGEDAENSLKAIQRENNAVGRFAAAELKGSQLRRRAE